jgi:hypothetical protein
MAQIDNQGAYRAVFTSSVEGSRGPEPPKHRSEFWGAHGGCYVAHAPVWRRYTGALGYVDSKSVTNRRLLCRASLQAKWRSSKKAKTSAFQGFWTGRGGVAARHVDNARETLCKWTSDNQGKQNR